MNTLTKFMHVQAMTALYNAINYISQMDFRDAKKRRERS